ncbi:DUF1847 domain-containing protein [bacterium]|nr:DUF1847 domain-containing protein [bacterium]
MNCLDCKNANCQIAKQDCNGAREEIISIYNEADNKKIYEEADRLVAKGSAGNLSRVQEIVRYARSNNIKKISIAYCYGIERQAASFSEYLNENNILTSSYRCTINGISENDICEDLSDSVNCNPIGQAMAINKDSSELVVEFGLCLGHDILFHKYLEKPFTVLVVKDRVYNHRPLSFFESNQAEDSA